MTYYKEKCKQIKDHVTAQIVEESFTMFYEEVIIRGLQTFEGEEENKVLQLFKMRKTDEPLNRLLMEPRHEKLARRIAQGLEQEGLCGSSIECLTYAFESEVVVRGLLVLLPELDTELLMGIGKACNVSETFMTGHDIQSLHRQIIDNFLPPEHPEQGTFLQWPLDIFTKILNYFRNFTFPLRVNEAKPQPTRPPRNPSPPPAPSFPSPLCTRSSPQTLPSLQSSPFQDPNRRRKRNEEESPLTPRSKRRRLSSKIRKGFPHSIQEHKSPSQSEVVVSEKKKGKGEREGRGTPVGIPIVNEKAVQRRRTPEEVDFYGEDITLD